MVKVLGGKFVERSFMSAFQHGPKGFNTVRVGLTPEVLANRFMRLGNAGVRLGIVFLFSLNDLKPEPRLCPDP